MNSRKWNQIDTLYAIGTILVILGHSHSSNWVSFTGTVLELVITFVYVFHMPLFIFIAGFLFFNSKSLLSTGYRKWIIAKGQKLLTPYVILSVVAFVPKYYFEHFGFDGVINHLLEVIFVPRLGV